MPGGWRTRLRRAALTAVVIALPSSVRADQLEPLTVGVGVVATAGASFIDAPTDQTIRVGGATAVPVSIPEYPGFAGPTYGLGPFVELRLFERVALELDVVRSRERGRAELHVERQGAARDYALQIGHDALHLPVLFKSILPTGWIRPTLLVGPELVLPAAATASVVRGELPPELRIAASASPFLAYTGGVGVEIDLPLEVLDLRVAATLRGSLTPAMGERRTERASYEGSDVHRLDLVTYRTRWRYQAFGTLAAGVYF